MFGKFFVWRVVRPQCESSARLKLALYATKPFECIQRFVALVEKMLRGMVDVQQHSVELSVGCRGVEPRAGELEKIALPQFASLISRERFAERNQSAKVPIDHRLK